MILMDTLSTQIGKNVRERLTALNLSLDEEQIRKYVLRKFATNAKPPTFKEITEELRPSIVLAKHTIRKLRGADILSTIGDEILTSYPFSAAETSHRVAFKDGREVFALCTTDAVGVHFLLHEDITVFSKCPECEEQLTIVMKNGRLNDCKPLGIIEFVSRRSQCGCNAESLCPHINFFCSSRHLTKWLERNIEQREGMIYSIDEVVEHGKAIYDDFLDDVK